jgi:peptidoglycan/LPS O-acetylase OafA/YrhL
MQLCFVLCVAFLLSIGYFTPAFVASRQFLTWAFGQLLLGHTYTPGYLRAFGSGTLNGSLWTIAVELQFYVLTPAISVIMARYPRLWLPTIATFALANVLFINVVRTETLASELLNVTFVPWIYMFLIGAWLSTRHETVEKIIGAPITILMAIFGASAITTYFAGMPVGQNDINPLMFVAEALLIFRLAYTKPTLARSVLRENDFSYGLYVYHMPIVNVAIWAGLSGSIKWTALTVLIAAIAAVLSWFMIEKPAISLKHRLLVRRNSATSSLPLNGPLAAPEPESN